MSYRTLSLAPLDKGLVHTGDLIFPWQKGIRQDAEVDSQQKTRKFFNGMMEKSVSNNQKQKTLAEDLSK